MLKKAVIGAAGLLFAAWLFVHWDRVTGDADAVIRFGLGVLFGLLVILRRKDPEKQRFRIPGFFFPLALFGGTLGALLGIIFRINMLEWAGVLLLLAACCVWVLPAHHRPDVLLGFLILFWVHPLPGQIFGWMQGGMQRLSVMGSELVLHTLNVRVWGDGIVLRTGYQNFLVPEVCSGMRTSVTVFLCALGVGLLLRLRWFETLFFIVLGLFQVLLLNITRISFMVVWAPRMPPEWAENFLHDSLGLFLMIGVALVQFEAGGWCWWSRRRAYRREAIKRREIEAPERASIVPHALRRLVFVMVILGGVGLIGVGVFAISYKSRASHRKEMIRSVAEGLLETDPVSAERATRVMRRMFPDDTQLISMQANAKVLQGRFEEALLLLAKIEASGAGLSLQESVMKAWSLSRVGRLSEARRLVGELGPAHERIPGVAMMNAEFAAMDGMPSEVSRHIVHASASHMLLPRIRALFPYLARHEQWEAIARADHDRPYAEFHQALIAIYANQQVDNLSGLVRVMRQALTRWADDPRLMGALFEIASRREGGEWEQYFEANLRTNLMQLTVDGLSAAAGYCWRLSRPDLAWQVYLRMEQVSSGDPELLVAPARFGGGWTQIRRRRIGVATEEMDRTIDVRPVLQLLHALEPVAGVQRRIPLWDETRDLANQAAVDRHLQSGLAELERRDEAGTLSLRLMRLYPVVLAMLRQYEEAHGRLDRILEVYPEQEAEVLLQHAVFYDQQQRWAESYEVLQRWRALVGTQNLTADLLEIGALMNLNMGVAAMSKLEEARQQFPGTVRLDLAESAIWDVFGFKAQALHVLKRTRAGAGSAVAAELYEQTGRLLEAQRLRSSLGLPQPRTGRLDRPLWLSPAEWALMPRWPDPPDRAEREADIRALREQRQEARRSPFVQGVLDLQLDWHASLVEQSYVAVPAEARSELVSKWEQIGRTPREKATAVYQLAMYAARQKDHALAIEALRQASAHLPGSAVIWRARLALEGRDPDVIEAARQACPHDPEIFLGALVARLEASGEGEARAWLDEMTPMALQESVFPVETLVRAGSFLLAQGWRAEAIPFARAVEARAGDLLAGHVFVMRAAMMNEDGPRALAATLRGIELAIDKVPFYRALVDLKVARREVDSDLLAALEYLQARQPQDPRWAEALGSLYFERGDMRRALAIFGSVIDEDIRGVQVRTLLLAAESARLENRLDRAVRILESAYALQPDQPAVLNNLVYLLAQRSETLARARSLLPVLLEMDSESFPILDTAAVVAMRAGDLDRAEAFIMQALEAIDMDAYGAHEVRLNLAELQMRQGRTEEARRSLEALRSDAQRPDFVEQRARQMLREMGVRGP